MADKLVAKMDYLKEGLIKTADHKYKGKWKSIDFILARPTITSMSGKQFVGIETKRGKYDGISSPAINRVGKELQVQLNLSDEKWLGFTMTIQADHSSSCSVRHDPSMELLADVETRLF